jgi:hypothetical protein
MSSLVNVIYNKQNADVLKSSILVPVFPGLLSIVIEGVKYKIETRKYDYVLPNTLVPKTLEDCSTAADWLLEQNANKRNELDRWFDFMHNIICCVDNTIAKPLKIYVNDWSASAVLKHIHNNTMSHVHEYNVHSILYLLWQLETKED